MFGASFVYDPCLGVFFILLRDVKFPPFIGVDVIPLFGVLNAEDPLFKGNFFVLSVPRLDVPTVEGFFYILLPGFTVLIVVLYFF